MRIRNIKPEFWTSEDIAGLDWNTRLVFIGLWSYVDDNGVGRDVEKLIVSSLFPLEDDIHATRMLITCSLQHLENAGLIARYKVGERSYLEITGWDKHQYIPRPNKPRYPSVTSANAQLHEPDMGEHANDMQDAANDVSGTEGQGDRGSGGQREKTSPNPSDDDSFIEFYMAYPRKENRGAAAKAYIKARKKVSHQTLLEGAQRYAADPNREQPFTKMPATWLNAESWDDDPLPSKNQSQAPARNDSWMTR